MRGVVNFGMRNNKKHHMLPLLILSALLLMGAGGDIPEVDERRDLLEQQKQLTEKVERLTQEQKFLLFQKKFYESDSKYLLLDFSARKGTLKYKNRVLRTFDFARAGRAFSSPKAGVVVLTDKRDGHAHKRALVFGASLVVHSKRYNGPARNWKDVPRISVGTKDLSAVFYAVEKGTMGYVLGKRHSE